MFFSEVIPAVLLIVLAAISIGNIRPSYTFWGWGVWALLTLILWGLTAKRVYKAHGREVLKTYLVWVLFIVAVMILKLSDIFSSSVIYHN